MAKKTNEKLNKELEKLEEEINGKETETPKTTTRGRKPKAVEPRVVEMPVEEEVKVEAPVTRKRVKVKEVKVVVEEEPLATPDDFSAPF